MQYPALLVSIYIVKYIMRRYRRPLFITTKRIHLLQVHVSQKVELCDHAEQEKPSDLVFCVGLSNEGFFAK